MLAANVPSPTTGHFDDFIDGYFPLEVSVLHLMERRGLSFARLTLTQAPIMHIPDLHPDAPVPLNITAGRAGMIDQMVLMVQAAGQTCRLQGHASWRWLDGSDTGRTFDPQTRLAEPAYLHGKAMRAADMPSFDGASIRQV